MGSMRSRRSGGEGLSSQAAMWAGVALTLLAVGCAGETAAVRCASGTYDDDGDAATECVAWTQCGAGEYVSARGSRDTDRECAPCATSTFSAGANAAFCSAWSACVAGEYLTAVGTATSDQMCSGCISGTFSDVATAAACTAWTVCIAGEYVIFAGDVTVDQVCVACAAGTYTSGPNQSMCVPLDGCAPGTEQTAAGTSTMPPVCETCVAGEHCAGGTTLRVACDDSDGTWDHDDDPATACVARTPCATGTYVSAEGDATTDRSCTAWSVCGSGYIEGMPGSTTADRTCVLEPWTRQFGTTLEDEAQSVAVDSSGNVYVAGTISGALPGQTALGRFDAYVRKYDSAGTEVWTRQFGSPGGDRALSVSVDSSGGVYVAGSTDGALPGQTALGSLDAYVRKYDSAGNELWTRQFGSPDSDYPLSVSVDSSGGVYVAGTTRGALPGQTSLGGFDAFVRKYDGAGTEVWTRQIGSAEGDGADSVSVDSSGGVYVAGYISGALPGQAFLGGADAFVRKYDSAGIEVWTRQFGSPESDLANSVSVDGSGNVYVAGDTRGVLPGQTYLGSSDAFVRKYDSAGIEVWTQQFGTAELDNASSVSVDSSSGGVYVAGQVRAALPGQTHLGGSDAFVMRLATP